MHCVVLYEILNQAASTSELRSGPGSHHSVTVSTKLSPRDVPDANIFGGMSETQWREVRKVIITSILGTDMAHHFDQVKKTNLFADINAESIMSYYKGETEKMDCISDNNNRMFVMEVLLHSSDISNPFKPFPICAKWADLVMAEFFAQGDAERELGFDISPGFDRRVTNKFNMQMGFIEFVVAPLISGMFFILLILYFSLLLLFLFYVLIAVVNTFPSLHEVGTNMTTNFALWGQKRLEEIPNDDNVTPENKATEISKLESRLAAFKDKMAFLDKCRDSFNDAQKAKDVLIEQAERAVTGSK